MQFAAGIFLYILGTTMLLRVVAWERIFGVRSERGESMFVFGCAAFVIVAATMVVSA